MLQLFLWLITALILAIALIVVSGKSTRDSIYSNAMFAVVLVATACWVAGVTLFLGADSVLSAGVYAKLTYIAGLSIPLGFWLYAFSLIKGQHKLLVRSIFSLIGVTIVAVFATLIISDGSLIFSSIAITPAGNTFVANPGWFIQAYLGTFFVFFLTYISIIQHRSNAARRAKDIESSKGYRNINLGLIIGSFPTVYFDGILPIVGNTELVWVGPVSISIAMIVVYFTTLRYKMFITANRTMQYLANLVLVLFAALIYSAIFYLLFLVIFRGAEPALPVIALNFVMTLILILLVPTLNIARDYISGLIKQKGPK